MKILVTDVRAFEREVNRLNKRVAKIGLAPITFTSLGRKTVTQTRIVVVVGEDGAEEHSRQVPVDVTEYEIALPSVEDYRWTLAATVTPTDSGRAFVDAHQPDLDRARYEADPCRCEHCHTNRHRNLTYVVRNKDDGREMQVGRNCFEDYVGHNGLLALEFMSVVCTQFRDGEMFPVEGFGSSKAKVASVRHAIAVAEAIAQVQGGWRNNRSDKFTGERTQDGTHRLAADFIRSPEADAYNDIRHEVNELSKSGSPIYTKVDAALERMRDLDAGDNEFAQALSYCSQFEVVPVNKASLVAYTCEFFRSEDRKQEREAKKATMRHVGEVGKREVFTRLTCKRVSTSEGRFGTTYIHTFEDPDGNMLTWFASNSVVGEGETVTLKATVKSHGVFADAPQTVITRAKVLKL